MNDDGSESQFRFRYPIDVMQIHPDNHFIKPNLLAIACGWLACLLIAAAPVSAQQYPGVKCIVNGNSQCSVRHSVKFGQGNVFFGSQAAVAHFQNRVLDKLELSQQPEQSLMLKANHQLAVTKQVKQKRCPITGKSIEKDQFLVIAGVKVFFHDSEAKTKMKAAESTWHRAQKVFASDAFAKNFVVQEKPLVQAAKVAQAEPSVAEVADSSSKLPAVNKGQANPPATR